MMAKIAPCQAFYDLMKSWRKLANSTEGLRSLGTKKDLYAGPLAINLHQNRDLVTVQYRKREDGTIFVYYKLNTA